MYYSTRLQFVVLLFFVSGGCCDSVSAQESMQTGLVPSVFQTSDVGRSTAARNNVLQPIRSQLSNQVAGGQEPAPVVADGEELPAPLDEPTLQIQGISDLTGLIEFYRARRGVNVLLSPDQQSLLSKYRIQVNPEFQFPESDLDELLVQLLRLYGLGLVPLADRPSWYQVVQLSDLRPFASLLLDDSDTPAGPYATKLFRLRNITAQQFRDQIAPFIPRMTETDSNAIAYLDRWNMVLITDLVSNLERVDRLLSRLDVQAEEAITESIRVVNMPAVELKSELDRILSDLSLPKSDMGGTLPGATGWTEQAAESGIPMVASPRARVAADMRGNRLLIQGTREKVAEVLKLVEQLDQKTGATTIVQLEHISGSEFAKALQQRFGSEGGQQSGGLKFELRTDNRSLIVTGPDHLLAMVDDLKRLFDRPVTAEDSNPRIRIYKIKHVLAENLLETIQSIQQRRRSTPRSPARGVTSRGITNIGPSGGGSIRQRDGMGTINEQMDALASGQSFDRRDNGPIRGDRMGGDRDMALSAFPGDPRGAFTPTGFRDESYEAPDRQSVLSQAFVTVDQNSNSLIVDADPEIHAWYKDLIERLDKRRAQVLIEVSVVAISQADDLRIGIDISGGDRRGANTAVVFTQFGLSTANAGTGALTLRPAAGFNGAILRPEIADVLLQALATHSRARVISAPRILVNDNATGTLSSVAEVPFAGLNASLNFTSTTLQGFAEAGTTISMTPQISEADHLNLEFDVLVNDFTGDGTETLPPPRQSNQVTSEVAIPDGHTVIVGGLTRERWSRSDSGIPYLERIPVLRLLGGSTTRGETADRLFVFIRPIILRDEQFTDLLNVSGKPLQIAEVSDGFPVSAPVIMK